MELISIYKHEHLVKFKKKEKKKQITPPPKNKHSPGLGYTNLN